MAAQTDFHISNINQVHIITYLHFYIKVWLNCGQKFMLYMIIFLTFYYVNMKFWLRVRCGYITIIVISLDLNLSSSPHSCFNICGPSKSYRPPSLLHSPSHTHCVTCEASPASLLCHGLFLASHLWTKPSIRCLPLNTSLNTPAVHRPLLACTQCICWFLTEPDSKPHLGQSMPLLLVNPPIHLPTNHHQ